jgi:hypothetical protein
VRLSLLESLPFIPDFSIQGGIAKMIDLLETLPDPDDLASDGFCVHKPSSDAGTYPRTKDDKPIRFAPLKRIAVVWSRNDADGLVPKHVRLPSSGLFDPMTESISIMPGLPGGWYSG